jgi:hypothetical protein
MIEPNQASGPWADVVRGAIEADQLEARESAGVRLGGGWRCGMSREGRKLTLSSAQAELSAHCGPASLQRAVTASLFCGSLLGLLARRHRSGNLALNRVRNLFAKAYLLCAGSHKIK